ncbi:MAG: porin [Blastocatellia bacterium]|nr:porin [Blastocatellia bacterium]
MKKKLIFLLILVFLSSSSTKAQEVALERTEVEEIPNLPALTERERLLFEKILELENRLNILEKRLATDMLARETLKATSQNDSQEKNSPLDSIDKESLDLLRDTTINLTIDGYYGYNFNRPIGRANLLRVYDVVSNSFSLNQASIVVEKLPKVNEGKRFGGRLDLMFGQATETLQGSASNELRPQTFRHIFQAYGTYAFPFGKGLTVDFGKFASSLGIETNYTKDQINYSRSLFFNFLPYYHFGFRSNYAFNDKVNFTHWLVNGTQQSEDFNGFKSQALILNIKPTPKVSLNLNYYRGIEGKDVVANPNPTFPTLPTQPGIPTTAIKPAPRGKFHVLDAYATWNITDKLTVAGELDYVVSRLQTFSPPSVVYGGAAYFRYQLNPKFAIGMRGEYFGDRAGLFSGADQAIKETTVTFDYLVTNGFMMRAEYRRDFSNKAFFLTNDPSLLKKEQNTATLGLVWWFGGKKGVW